MQEFTVRLRKITYHDATVVVRAENADDAEDKATDLYYQDDGCHGVRERMEFAGGFIDIKVQGEPNPLGTAATVSEPF